MLHTFFGHFFFLKGNKRPSLSGFTITVSENNYHDHSSLTAGNILLWEICFILQVFRVCVCVSVCISIYHVDKESMVFYVIILTAVVSLFRVLQFYERNHK